VSDEKLQAAPPQTGTWTLIAPDGRTWTAESPLKVCAAEQRDRIPAEIMLQRIFEAVDKYEKSAMDDCLSPARDPSKCYRVRCNLGKKCVANGSCEDD